MLSRRALNFTAVAAAVLLVPACDTLLPDRRQVLLDPATLADSAPAPAQVKRRPATRSAPAEPRREATGPEAATAFDHIRRSLRLLVAAEQGFYAENGAYTADLGRLGFRPSGESQVKFLWLTRQGWAASGTHPALPGRDCVTFVGPANGPPTTLRFVRSGREGVLVCDVQHEARPAAGNVSGNAAANASPASPSVADTSSALDAVNPTVQMRVDLRNLAIAQAAYFGTQGVYSGRPEQLQLQFAYWRGVSVVVLKADQRSWAARARHTALPGRSCVMWYGSPAIRPGTDAQRKVPARGGVPACDD